MKTIHIQTLNTSYIMGVLPSGHLEHLYYGRSIDIADAKLLSETAVFPNNNCIVYSDEFPTLTLENRALEVSSVGKGDIRYPMIDLSYADSTYVSDFLFEKIEYIQGKPELCSLPSSYGDQDNVTTILITLKEKVRNVRLLCYYHAFYKSDVLVRSHKLLNEQDEPLTIKGLFSAQWDSWEDQWEVVSFDGHWARERYKHVRPTGFGRTILESNAGISSSRQNPLFFLKKANTDEQSGECVGFNLIYSGNFQNSIELNAYGKTRVLWGINPLNFSYPLGPYESFETPEAIMTYSHQGFNRASQNFHHFVNHHIIRGVWKNKVRPIVLNNWEATYFNFNEKRLLSLAKEAADIGVECFVLDDGWFKERNNDTKALGDWSEDKQKLPFGLERLSCRIHAMGMLFGIWVEPEMVNVDSDCYRLHPEWVVQLPDRRPSKGRNQLCLDLSNPEVQDWIIDQMTAVFNSAQIEFVKWDYNRILSDMFGSTLANQGTFTHQYIVGLSRILKELITRFPQLLLESCASGGNRFDLGMLCYSPQIWTSDNTDVLDRTQIQTNTSYGYPLSTLSTHISAVPNHQTQRYSPLYSRLYVSSFGVFGCEINLQDSSKKEKQQIAQHIAWYKEMRSVLQFGTFYRICNDENQVRWMVVSEDQSVGIGLLFQSRNLVNDRNIRFKTVGLDEQKLYEIESLPFDMSILDFGDLINYVSPIHIKPNSLLHKTVAQIKKVKCEKESGILMGSVLNAVGWTLKQPFTAGLSDETRVFFDQSARIYIFKEISAEIIADTQSA